MRKLTIIIFVLVLVWAGYLLAGDWLIKRQTSAFLQQNDETISVGSFEIKGFPTGFSLSFNDFRFFDPRDFNGYAAPRLNLRAAGWAPWRVNITFPQEQALLVNGHEITVTSENLAGRLRARPSLSLPLAQLRVSGNGLTITSPWTGLAEIDTARFELNAANDARTYALLLDIAEMRPDPAFQEATRAHGLAALPDRIDTIRMDADLRLSAPLDRFTGQAPLHLEAIEIRNIEIAWGPMRLSAAGHLAPDERGFATGRLDFVAEGWNFLPPLLVEAGLLAPGVVTLAQNLFQRLASEDRKEGKVRLPLVMKNGRMSLGPLPLGPAPMFSADQAE